MKWTQVQCYHCGGSGHRLVYSAQDFEGESECGVCGGKGYIFVSPKGALAEYPGGPFCGREQRTSSPDGSVSTPTL